MLRKVILVLALIVSISLAVLSFYNYEEKRQARIEEIERKISVIEAHLVLNYYEKNPDNSYQYTKPELRCTEPL